MNKINITSHYIPVEKRWFFMMISLKNKKFPPLLLSFLLVFNILSFTAPLTYAEDSPPTQTLTSVEMPDPDTFQSLENINQWLEALFDDEDLTDQVLDLDWLLAETELEADETTHTLALALTEQGMLVFFDALNPEEPVTIDEPITEDKTDAETQQSETQEEPEVAEEEPKEDLEEDLEYEELQEPEEQELLIEEEQDEETELESQPEELEEEPLEEDLRSFTINSENELKPSVIKPLGIDSKERETSQELLVRFTPGAARNANAMAQVHNQVGASVVKSFDFVPGLQLVNVSRGQSIDAAIRRYEQNPNIVYAEPNHTVQAFTTPNDPYFEHLWGLHNTGQTFEGQTGTPGADIDALSAWEIETGSRDVIIAVIDSGVDYTHPDLSANMWTNSQGHYGKNTILNNNDPMDDNGHGTHVAGTIAATGNNTTGVTGVMWEASIMALKALNSNGNGTIADIVQAIEYAENNGAHIINLSLGGNHYSQSLYDALESTSALVVAAAGNSSADNDTTPSYPANYDLPNIISVAATDNQDQLASFSNYGASTVDVAAPGVSILSTYFAPNYDEGSIYFEDDFENEADWNSNWDTSFHQYNEWFRANKNIGGASGSYSASYQAHAAFLNQENPEASWIDLNQSLDLTNVDAAYIGFHIQTNLSPEAELYMLLNDGDLGGARINLDSEYTYYLEYDLSSFSGTVIDLVSFFVKSSSSEYINEGVFIDNFFVKTTSSTLQAYSYSEGTSMAAPHVAGVAGLLLSADPSLSNSELISAIVGSVDELESLNGKVSSGGRVNARKALNKVIASSGPVIHSVDVETTVSPAVTDQPITWNSNASGTGLTYYWRVYRDGSLVYSDSAYSTTNNPFTYTPSEPGVYTARSYVRDVNYTPMVHQLSEPIEIFP